MKNVKKIIIMAAVAVLLGSILTACDNSRKGAESIGTPPEMKGEITINVYESEEWLEMAVQMFEKKYPEMKVTIQSFFNGTNEVIVENGGVTAIDRPTGQTKEDYAMWLNTRLLSGSAGDIVITSEGLPIGKYENMGVLEDLTPYLENAGEINAEGYYMNILDAYRTEEGALYQFPISAMASPLLCFDKEIVDDTGHMAEIDGKSMTWREALSLAEEMLDTTDLKGKVLPDSRSFLGNIFVKELIASVDYGTGKMELREEEMREILEAFEEFYYYHTYGFGSDSYPETVQLRYVPDTQSASQMIAGIEVAVQWEQSDGKVCLSPYFTKDFGINSQSSNKALAWEFLKFLLSDEVQTLPSFPNASINKKGLQARVEAYCSFYDFTKEEEEEMLDLIDGWLSQVDGYRAEDTDLIQAGDAIVGGFLNGDFTVDEAIEESRLRLEQYLSE